MFKLHIYNPEHDIALAKNIPMFTPPRAARITRERFCHIPALWADDGDWVLVDEVEPTQALPKGGMSDSYAKVKFVTWNDLRKLKKEELPSMIEPWGWDKLVVNTLLKANPLFASLVPSERELDDIRRMSSRGFVADEILPRLVAMDSSYVGRMEKFFGTVEDMERLLQQHESLIVKSPWSCSGRGVRLFRLPLKESEKGWIQNVVSEQGYMMVEPVYDKVMDFAMEFMADKNGVTRFLGINVFETNNGAYIGNLGNTNEERISMLTQYVSEELIEQTKQRVIELTTTIFKDRYSGPFGIDMMIVSSPAPEGEVIYRERNCTERTKVHPCVEMNLRRTMGHVIY